jgi:predicted permease
MDDLHRELSQAARRLRRAPIFTLTAVGTLAIAIAANVAVFTLVNRVVLNPLPFSDSDRLVDLDHALPGANIATGVVISTGLYEHYSTEAKTLESVAIYRVAEATLTGRGEPARIRVSLVTPSLAEVLRVQPAIGRWLFAEEAAPGATPTAVLSHGLWTQRFGGDLAVIGRTVALDGQATVVVGVMPRNFAFPDPQVQLWTPIRIGPRAVFDDFSYAGLARLRGSASIAEARRELGDIIGRLPATYSDDAGLERLVTRGKLASNLRPLKDAKVGRITTLLWILLAAVGFVLLVACANVANLFLVRGETRLLEITVRRALGAGRAPIALFYAAESAWIALLGGTLGVAGAFGTVRLLVAFGPANLPRLEEVAVDTMALAYSTLLTLLAAGLFTLLPMWRSAAAAPALHVAARGNTAAQGSHRARHALMAVQVALALVLLVAASLIGRSLWNLRSIEPGFDSRSALTFRLGLPEREFASPRAVVAAHQTVLDRLAALPEVVGVSAATRVPLSTTGRGFSSPVRVDERTLPAGVAHPIASFLAVAGEYFDVLGTPMRRGRGISSRDVERRELVAVINQALATVLFANQDPIGARIARGTETVKSSWLTVVGVVANTPVTSLTEATAARAVPEVYLPMSIAGPEAPGYSSNGPAVLAMSYLVRTATPPLNLRPLVRRVVHSVHPELAIAQVTTLDELREGGSAQMAFTMTLMTIAALVAVALGLIGIYGAVSYIVVQRTSEIGVRLALGAEPRAVAAMIVRQAGLVTLAGIAAGLAAALAAMRLIETTLYEVSPRDPLVFSLAVPALFIAALVACWVPARRASRLDPMRALRAD